jgi:hypothetical protein
MALARLRRLPDGGFAFRVKCARSGCAKYRIMTPLELLARIAAILPPPRFPLTRMHGVLAPRSSWRKDVVPAGVLAVDAANLVSGAEVG